jgi:hypothetical protein
MDHSDEHGDQTNPSAAPSSAEPVKRKTSSTLLGETLKRKKTEETPIAFESELSGMQSGMVQRVPQSCHGYDRQ